MSWKVNCIRILIRRRVSRSESISTSIHRLGRIDFEQQLGDYEKELKMLKVKLDAANNELECND